MLRRDWSLKPNGEAYQDLVFKRWWTNADEIEVKAGGKSKTIPASLPKEGATVECVLE